MAVMVSSNSPAAANGRHPTGGRGVLHGGGRILPRLRVGRSAEGLHPLPVGGQGLGRELAGVTGEETAAGRGRPPLTSGVDQPVGTPGGVRRDPMSSAVAGAEDTIFGKARAIGSPARCRGKRASVTWLLPVPSMGTGAAFAIRRRDIASRRVVLRLADAPPWSHRNHNPGSVTHGLRKRRPPGLNRDGTPAAVRPGTSSTARARRRRSSGCRPTVRLFVYGAAVG